MPLSDYRTALVTGATSGIGGAIARNLAERGLEVHAVGRRKLRLQELAKESGAATHAIDLRDRQAIYDGVAGLEIDILVHSAGVGSTFATFTELDPDDIDATVETNLLAGVHLARALSPGMVARGRGHIVTIGSIFGLHAIGAAVYGASKGGVHLLSQDLRHELKGSGVRVTEVCPGRTRTEFFDRATDDPEVKAALFDSFEILTPEDVAAAVLFALDQPWHVNISLIELTATEQVPGGACIAPVDRDRDA